jgi:CHAT domain-containing protein
VWWCLSGPLAFLPIHAAGLYSARYRAPGNKLVDFAVSSYAPSLTALVDAARRKSNTVPKLLAVAFPEDSDLPATQGEIDAIVARGPPSVVKLLNSEATVGDVVSRLKDCNFVHFACHGVQKLDNPLDSSLLLANRSSLSLAKLSTLHLPEAQLAYLSACQTAACDPLVAEESVHLGAGVFVAGYRSVIATMWSTLDEDGPIIADAVYAHLFGKGRDAIDATDAARALHLATKRLRESSPNKSYLSWLPYVHIGV